MRSFIVVAALAVTCSSIASTSASADTIAVGDTVRFLGSDGTISGGAFHVDNLATGPGRTFSRSACSARSTSTTRARSSSAASPTTRMTAGGRTTCQTKRCGYMHASGRVSWAATTRMKSRPPSGNSRANGAPPSAIRTS